MENFRPIKIVVMGFKCSHAAGLFDIVKQSPFYELVAVSFDEETKISIEQRYHDKGYFDKVKYYFSDEEMLNANPGVELCICGGENSEHLKQYKLCAERGIDVIMMKVPTLDMDEYAEMQNLGKENGIKTFLEMEMRWYAAVERQKKLSKAENLAKLLRLLFITIRIFQCGGCLG